MHHHHHGFFSHLGHDISHIGKDILNIGEHVIEHEAITILENTATSLL